MLEDFHFEIGDFVQKVRNYPFPGIIIARGHTTHYEARYIVECTAPGVEGCLHVFGNRDLARRL